MLLVSIAAYAQPAYRADTVPVLGPGAPSRVEILRPGDGSPWPAAVVDDLRRRVLREWSSGQSYGPIEANLGVWLQGPLVTSGPDGRVVVPVVEANEIPIRGRLSEMRTHARRLILLLDVSESADRTTYLLDGDDWRRVSVLEAARRSAERLLDLLEIRRGQMAHFAGYRADRVGIIAFGEGTHVIAEPDDSLERVRQRLRAPEAAAAGRSDAACALRTAAEWVREAGPATVVDVVLLTSGDLPHSGRFTDCSMHPRWSREREACLATLNRSTCPAGDFTGRAKARSDVSQLFALARAARARARISVLLFQTEPPPRYFREIASHTGGVAVQVDSVGASEWALGRVLEEREPPAEVAGVLARNLTTGEESGNLLQPNRRDFEGSVPLHPGPNDVELRVDVDDGVVGVFRFRIYSVARAAEEFLERLQERNSELDRARDANVEEARELMHRPEPPREVEVGVDPEATSADDGVTPDP